MNVAEWPERWEIETAQDVYICNFMFFLKRVPQILEYSVSINLDLPQTSGHVSALQCMDSGRMETSLWGQLRSGTSLGGNTVQGLLSEYVEEYGSSFVAKQGIQVA